jgi:hypothetical protein
MMSFMKAGVSLHMKTAGMPQRDDNQSHQIRTAFVVVLVQHDAM